MLEVQILDIETRVPWGINNTSATGGVFSSRYPGVRPDDPQLDIPQRRRHVIRTGEVDGREVAFFADDIQVPLAPFMGILAVAPDPVVGEPGVTLRGVQSSRPPGAYGGNLDVKDSQGRNDRLSSGLPSWRALLHGDPHGAQGDGEVSGTAIEQSLSAVFRFVGAQRRELGGPTRGNRYPLPPNGNRPRPRPSDSARHVGGCGLPRKGEGAHAGQSPFTRKHCCRFPRE